MAFNIIPQLKAPGVQIGEAGNDYAKALLSGAQATNFQGENLRANQMQPYDIALKQAQAANQQSEADLNPVRMEDLRKKMIEQDIINRNKQAEIDAEIAGKKAQANYWNMGGGRGSVGLKDQMALMQQAIKDNPGKDLNWANDVTNAWLSGESSLPDGTPVPDPSGNAVSMIDRISRGRTTAQQLNQVLNAKQSDSELAALEQHANEGLKPYGTTYFNKSPQQIMDTFRSDDASQERLGKFIASQALQFEIAQIRNRIAMGQPGITSTQDMMNRTQQTIDARYPRLSAKARRIASDELSAAIREGLKARLKVGVGAAGAFQNNGQPAPPAGQKTKKWKIDNGKLVEA